MGDLKLFRLIFEDFVDEKYIILDKLWFGYINRIKRNLERGIGFIVYIVNLDKFLNIIVVCYGKDGKECFIF